MFLYGVHCLSAPIEYFQHRNIDRNSLNERITSRLVIALIRSCVICIKYLLL